MREQVEALEHHADPQADLALDPASPGGSIGGKSQAVDRHRPGLETLQPVEATEKRALAAARRPDDRRYLAGPTDRLTPLRTSIAPCHLTRSMTSIMLMPPPLLSCQGPESPSDHRENHESGRLIIIYMYDRGQSNSIAPPVLLARIEYSLVNSIRVMTEQTEVSLKRAMKSLVTGGSRSAPPGE